jgi:hypothetical protein
MMAKKLISYVMRMDWFSLAVVEWGKTINHYHHHCIAFLYDIQLHEE